MDNATARRCRRLLEQATVVLPQQGDSGVIVRRGMRFASREGSEVGRVAAVLVEDDPPRAVALLLDRLPAYRDYLCVPLELVASVAGETVSLVLNSEEFASLPRWRDPAGSSPQSAKEEPT
ncbi:MAG: hypothetical protein RRC07_11575 [Anaerolineae bacterium]|nr:hypothetical protein [Anaerolineae bacterium]